MRLPRLLAGGAVVAVVATTAACGAQALEPKVALRDALSDFAHARTGALELSFGSSAEDVRAFAKAADEGAGGEITDDDLETLLSSSIEFAYDFGEDRDSDSDDRTSAVVHVGDLDAGEIRVVDGLLYAHVDIDGLAERFPDMQPGIDELRSGLEGEDGASEPVPPEIVEPLTALLDGSWVVTDPMKYLEQMQAAMEAAGQTADPGLSDVSTAQARDLLGAALKDAVSSVERRAADDELGDHLVAHLNLRKAWTTLRAGLPDLFTGATAEQLEAEMPAVDEVPDKQIDVSFWVNDGELTRAELDLAQFLDEPAGHFVLRADTLPVPGITAPSDAVEFDLSAIAAAGMSSMGGAGVGEAEPVDDIDAYTVATWVDMDIASVAQDEGGQSSVSYLSDVQPYYDGLAEGLTLTAVGEQVQVAIGEDVVCLTLSPDGTSEDIVPGAC